MTAVNRLAGRHFGVHIELYRWEDTPPGFGRPQEIINQMVDECDLFIGLLWERWGQSTGKYSSGFEEEFERARDRRKTQGQPEIWLVFKEIDESKLKDPGPQLSHVLEFRKQQTEQQGGACLILSRRARNGRTNCKRGCWNRFSSWVPNKPSSPQVLFRPPNCHNRPGCLLTKKTHK